MSKRILVVDDEPAVLVIFKKVLSRDGHKVHTCTSAAEALSEHALGRFDLAVVDKNLPGISGLDLLALMRRADPTLPAILVTAYPEPILAPTVRLQGYLAKPFESLKAISDTARRVLELGELRRGRNDDHETSATPVLASAAHSRGSR